MTATENDKPDPSDEARARLAAMKSAFARQEWGDHTVLSIAATRSDEHGNFEVALLDEGQPVWEPKRCNVNAPDTEFQTVMNDVCDFYQQWQAERYGWFGSWKTGNEPQEHGE